MMRALSATPATPSALSRCAATVPATCVPCVSLSAALYSCAFSSAKFQPWTSSFRPSPSSSTLLPGISPGFVHRRPERSGWVVSMPVSMTATVTGVPVVAASQPAGAPIFGSAHCDPYSGSSGTSIGCRRRSRWTASAAGSPASSARARASDSGWFSV